jgi:ribosomal RNA-processing protein 36
LYAKWKDTQLKEEEKRRKRAEKESEMKKKEKEAVKQGKKPFYMKKCEYG